MDTKPEEFPATSPPLPDDYSDVTADSQDETSERRKYQRGGRKQTKTSRIPPISESQIPEEPQHREETKENGVETELKETTCPECAARKQAAETTKPPQTPFETGIRAFNLKKAASSGGRPIGVRPTSESTKPEKKSSKNKKKKKKKRKVEEKDSESEESSESEDEQEQGEQDRKPMSIRLDLNIVLEIFLKAKIQGDVTITFLE